MKSYSIPSKYPSQEAMLKSCTGYVKPNSRDEITAPQGKRSVQHIKKNYERIAIII
jgi:hypothetical protein